MQRNARRQLNSSESRPEVDAARLSLAWSTQARVFEASSSLLLQALVASPPPSSSGVVEELLASTSSDTEAMDTLMRSRAIGVAADVLSLVVSGDIALAKVRVSSNNLYIVTCCES